ncbi:hypothetical protein CVS53_02694 [Microbacterium oxydans]|nr:hypothetical protein CVS53_02694 [Microbacterium oxydans]
MTRVLILGASGQVAEQALGLLSDTDFDLTLFARDEGKLTNAPAGADVVAGDVLDAEQLDAAIQGQDIVYANLAGDVDQQAKAIVRSMTAAVVHRLVFVTALGIYDEVPGEFGRWNRSQIGSMLGPYRTAADIIEASDLDYTILRPAWLTDDEEIDYEVTEKGEPFQGTEVSRRSVAALVVDILHDPSKWSRSSLGIDKPGTDGDKPSFM